MTNIESAGDNQDENEADVRILLVGECKLVACAVCLNPIVMSTTSSVNSFCLHALAEICK